MKKNILVLNYEFPPLGGGASPVSYEIAKWYVDLGHHVDVVTMWYKGLPAFEVLDGIHIHRVKCWRSKKAVCYPWEQLSYLFSAYFTARKLLKKTTYDICHCHFIIPTGVLAWMLKKEFGLDYIVTAHGSDTPWYNQNRFTWIHNFTPPLLKRIINNSKKTICPSLFLKDLILKMDKNLEQKLQVIPNWIEKDKFRPLEKEKYILTVSRLQKGKWIQDLLEAIKDMDLWSWRIKIVWEWPYKETLQHMVKDYQLEDKVAFLGWVDNTSSEMRQLYGKAAIFCQPSYFESFGLTLLEAMQAGGVVTARDIPWFKWVLENTNNITFKDTKDLQVTLNNLINDEKWLKTISEDNIEKIKSFDWDEVVREYEKNL
jgi:glycosyltransferase involved in cell wall biosynthesis